MEPVEFALYSAFGAAILAFALWIWTNLHILRVGRGIRTDIEVKRLETQRFVEGQIGRIERSVADMRAQIPAEMPTKGELGLVRADIDAQITRLEEDLKGTFADIATDLQGARNEIQGLPARLSLIGKGEAGLEQRLAQKMLTEAGADIEHAASIKEAMAMGDPEMMKLAAMKKIAEFSVTDKYAKEHPFLAMMIEMGKPKVLEMLETSFPGSAPSVSLQPSRSPRPVRGSSDI